MEPSVTEAIRVITKLTSVEDITQYIADIKSVNPRIWTTASATLENPVNSNLVRLQAALKESLSVDTQQLDRSFLENGGSQEEIDRLKKEEGTSNIILPSPPPKKRDVVETYTGRLFHTDQDRHLAKELQGVLEKIPEAVKQKLPLLRQLNDELDTYQKVMDPRELNSIEASFQNDISQALIKLEKNGAAEQVAAIRDVQTRMWINNEREGERVDFFAGKPDRRGQSWER